MKAAKARIAQEKVSAGNWFSNLFISNAKPNDGRKIKRNSLKETIKEVAGEITEEWADEIMPALRAIKKYFNTVKC